ncbi:MAG: AMP-binding protein, partial [Promethearchaeati archaeon]
MERPWYSSYVGDTPKEIEIPDGPLWKSLDDAVEEFPDNVALHYEGVEITFRELGELVGRFANGISKMGIGKGDAVALMLPNCPQFVIAYYGILKTGATV